MGANTGGWNPVALEGWLSEVQALRGLVGVSIENWVVLQRKKFDMHTHNEPHIAQTLYMDKGSGRFLHKVFGKTIRDGRLDTPSGLPELAQEIFEHSRVCQGFDSDLKGELWNSLAPGFHPYPRQMDPGCSFVFKDPSNTATVCPSCTQTMHCEVNQVLVEEVFEAVDHKPDADPKEKNDDTLNDLLDIDMDEPEASLWPFERKCKKIKYAESDFNSLDEDDEQGEGNRKKVDKRPKWDKSLIESDFDLSPVDESTATGSLKTTDEAGTLKRFHCNHCNKTFPHGGYLKHRALLRHRSRRIPCKVCAQPHYSFASLAKHLLMEHRQAPTSLTQHLQTPEQIKTMKRKQRCSTCKIYCNGLIMVKRHRDLYHELGNFQCTDCHEFHLTYYDMVLHNYNKHNRLAPYLEPSAEHLKKVEHEDGSIEWTKTRNTCPKCHKSYVGDGLFGIHMKVHHSWSVFTCQECDEMCHYATDFVDHVMNFHSENPEIKCPKCAEVISLREDPGCFDTHFKACTKTLLMKNLPKSQCERCGKKFYSPGQLQNHLKSHDGVNQFSCDKCDYATNQKSVMEFHERSHLRSEGKTQDASGNNLFFFCDRCPQTFVIKAGLKRHIQHVHEGIKRTLKCQQCDLTFGACSQLYAHKKSEHGYVSTQRRRKWLKR